MGKVINGIRDFSLCVYVCPRLRKKTFELSTPNLVHINSMAEHRYVLTLRSKVKVTRLIKWSRMHGCSQGSCAAAVAVAVGLSCMTA